jgi:uncharacterized RDD family membrane protein YckC
MSTQSWQVPCPRCGWANSGALTRCAKCGQPLGARRGMLVAGQSLSVKAEQPRSSKVARPGGFLPRLIALIVDLMILGAILLPINALWAAQLAPLDIKPDTNVAFETLQRRASLYLALVLIQLFYFAGSWTMLGATPGQLLMGLRVTNIGAGGIGFFRSALRWFWFTLFGPLSVITMVAGSNRRALHDILAGTYVIQVVDASEVEADSGLPAAFGGPPAQAAAAPAPAPAPAPDTTPAPVAASPVAAAVATGADYGSVRPAEPVSSADYVPAPPGIDFPALPMESPPEPAPLYVPAPLPGPPPAGPGGPQEGDESLYAPPPMIDPTPGPDDFAPLPAPTEREVYSPQPGHVSERALKSAELYATSPEFTAPPAAELAPAEPAASESGPAAEQRHAQDPDPQAPMHGGELPPFEFPPMAPPPEGQE